ncbi:MAG TPA: Asp-tRNA(Asn)/Glu-tRNA(Gln) amidotransferase subunit GatB [Candidatus Saccharimonadales bacterium]|nr:Asp-tRNA(Asn)/Glu-tRNA(Gln) amidotransferase subunit GatB [Candidatus Saccharimonadales bacterium]
MANYQPVIGIETHVQLKTKSKLFCACDNDARDKAPNTTVCPVCMGFPGVLPVLNEQAVKLAIRAGLALNGKMGGVTKFDRKNYFYPDLPHGYQITQFDQPIVGRGYVEFPNPDRSDLSTGRTCKVGITRAHLESDAGKLTHPDGADYSLVDYNRAGTPLLEIVSEPDMGSSAEAKAYAQEIYNLMRYAEVSDANLYYGNMRFDVNISIRPFDSAQGKPAPMGTRTEIKNLNSFRAVEKAAEYEFKRQADLLGKGDRIIQETRGWDDAKNRTFSQRSKEEAHDYRYFPEPDLPPLVITAAMIKQIKADLPSLPPQLRQEMSLAGIGLQEAEVLIGQPELMSIYAAVSQHQLEPNQLKRIVNWLVGEVQRIVLEHGYDGSSIEDDAGDLIKLSELVEQGKLSSTAAKQVLTAVIQDHAHDVQKIAEQMNLIQVSDSAELEKIVAAVITDSPKPVEQYKAGDTKVLGFLVGQVMKASRGQANPPMVNDILKKQLEK